MNTSFRFGNIFMLLLIFGLCKSVLSDEVNVIIMNRLGNRKITTVHCQSKDNDLGNQTIADGSQFGWNFSVNVWGTTLFYCDLGWEKVQDYHFDAYSFDRDYTRCESQCSWLISEEGVYGLNGQTGLWEFMYYWPN